MKNILVTIDFDDQARMLLDKAEELAIKFDSKIWVLHIAAPDPDFVGYEAGPQVVRDTRAETLREEHKKLQEYADQLEQKGLNVESLLVQGATAATIVQESIDLDADLIIMGYHEHSWLHKVFVGDSTALETISKSK